MKILHLAHNKPVPGLYTPVFVKAVREIGEFDIAENGAQMTEPERAALIRQYDVQIVDWGSETAPPELAKNPGRLKYICNLTGSIRGFAGLELLEAGILMTNWGDAPANGVAEGAFTLLLAALKDLHRHIVATRNGGWRLDGNTTGGSLKDLNVGVYGCGVIGLRFLEMLRPFGAVVRVFDPFAKEIPEWCIRVAGLDELFRRSQAIVIHAGLSDETRKSVTARHLALLPRYGVVINTARGAIVDHEALFAELKSGRLRAGLDVTDPEPVPADHECRQWENLILSGHCIERGWPNEGKIPDHLTYMQRICLDNLRRFERGQPLRFAFDRDRYLRST